MINDIPSPAGILTDDEASSIRAAGGPSAAPPELQSFFEAQLNQYDAFRVSAPRQVDLERRARQDQLLEDLTLDFDKATAGQDLTSIRLAPDDETRTRAKQSVTVDTYIKARTGPLAFSYKGVSREKIRDAVAVSTFGEGKGVGSDEAFMAEAKAWQTKSRSFRVQSEAVQQSGIEDALTMEPEDFMARASRLTDIYGSDTKLGPEEGQKLRETYLVSRQQAEGKVAALRPVATQIYGMLSKGKVARFGEEAQQGIEGAIDLLAALPEDQRGYVVAMLKKQAAPTSTDNGTEKTVEAGIRALTGQLRGFASTTERNWLGGGMRELTNSGSVDATLDTPEKITERIASGLPLLSKLEGDISGPITKPSRVVSPEEQAKVRELVDAKMTRNAVAGQAIGILEETIDPIKAAGLGQEIAIGVGGSLGAMAPMAVPYAGVFIAQGGYADTEYQRLLGNGVKPDVAHQASQITGAVQAAWERASFLFNFVPTSTLGQLSSKLAFTTPALVAGKTGMAFGVAGKLATTQLAEYTEEIAQAAAPMFTAALAGPLGLDLPQQAQFTAELERFQAEGEFGGLWRPDVYAVVAALTFLPAGARGVVETQQARELMIAKLADPDWSKAMGIKPEQAIVIAAMPAEERLAAYQESFPTRDASTPAAKAAAESVAAKAQQQAEWEQTQVAEAEAIGIRIRRTDAGGYEVQDATTGSTLSVATAGEAATTMRQVMLERGLLKEEAYLDALDKHISMMKPGRTIKLATAESDLLNELERATADERDMDVVRIWERADQYRLSIGKEVLERDRLNPDSRNALAEMSVYGTSTTAVREGVARSISLVLAGGDSLDLLEEQAENDYREAVLSGKISKDTMKAIINRIETATGDKYLFVDSDLGVTEAWSRIVRLYATGTASIKGNAITKGARVETLAKLRDQRRRLRKAETDGVTPSAFEKAKEYYTQLRAQLGQMVRLMKARDAGQLDDLETMIRESVGLKEQDTYDGQLAKEMEQSIPPPTTGMPDSWTSSMSVGSRAQPADTSNRTVMPDGAELIGPTSFSIGAWHGTPHEIRGRMSTTRILSGEGQIVYGWGLYFAGQRGIAEGYRKRLSREFAAKGKGISRRGMDIINEYYDDGMERVLFELLKPSNKIDLVTQQNAREAIDAMESTPGNLYTVELAPDEDDLLDWDKPLGQQSDKVKKIVSDFIKSLPENMQDDMYERSNDDLDLLLGNELYKILVKASQDGGILAENFDMTPPQEASMLLARAGIPGIKYLDGNSRRDGEGTSNYVIFDDKLITILEENGQPLPPADSQPDSTVGSFSVRGSWLVLGARPGDYGWKPSGLAGSAKEKADLQQELERLNEEPELNTDRITEVEDELRKIAARILPGPVTHPTQNKPRLDRVGVEAGKILKSGKAKSLLKDLFGITDLKVEPIIGTWLGNREPSFVIHGDNMTDEQAKQAGALLGFAWAQDATVVGRPNPSATEGIPAYYVGSKKRLSEQQIQIIHDTARGKGLDFSSTTDGKAVQFLFFGDEADLSAFEQSIADIQKAAGLPDAYTQLASTDLDETDTNFSTAAGRGRSQAWLQATPAGSSLFQRIVRDLIAPYAKAIGAEGYRFNVDLFAKRFGLSDEQAGIVANALYPANGKLKSAVPIMEGKVDLGVEGVTTKKGRFVASVTNVVWSLQNWSARQGLIAPGDYSAKAGKLVSQTIVDEVAWHVNKAIETGKRSAIGWYDRALKAAKAIYAQMFSELDVNGPDFDADKTMIFDALLGIASQGNNVTDNSVMAVRVYSVWRKGGMTITQAVEPVTGTFGSKTVAIENNYLKLETLLANNSYADLRKFFNKSDTVGNINAYLKKTKSLWFEGKPLEVEGASAQKVTGWMVFGPKIGSFINNLHGDYTTLTADLWFSRTWNRILGWSFIHAPDREAEQFVTLRDAMVAEYTNDQSVRKMEKGKPVYWDHGTDVTNLNLSPEEFDKFINDPQQMLDFATRTEEIFRTGAREGQEKTTSYKDKSAVRRAAKTWIENRENIMEAPRGDKERMFQQDVMEQAQKMLKRMGISITIADMQAALWYNEKDLFATLGSTTKLSAPADYEDAARTTRERIRIGTLFERQSKPAGKKSKKDKTAVEGEFVMVDAAAKPATVDRIQPKEWEQELFAGLDLGAAPAAQSTPEDSSASSMSVGPRRMDSDVDLQEKGRARLEQTQQNRQTAGDNFAELALSIIALGNTNLKQAIMTDRMRELEDKIRGGTITRQLFKQVFRPEYTRTAADWTDEEKAAVNQALAPFIATLEFEDSTKPASKSWRDIESDRINGTNAETSAVSMSIGPRAKLDAVQARLDARLEKDPAARRKVAAEAARRLRTLETNWTTERLTWNGKIQAIDEPRTKKSLDKEQAMRQAQFGKEAADEWRTGIDAKQKKDYSPRASLLRDMRTLDAIVGALPPEIRYQVGGQIKLAGLATDEARADEIARRIDRIAPLLERHLQKEFTASLEKLLERAEAQNAKPGEKMTGKLGPEVQHLMDAVRKAYKLTAAQTEDALAALDSRLADPDLTPEQQALAERERELVNLVGGWRPEYANSGRLDTLGRPIFSRVSEGASAAQMEAAYAAVEETYETGFQEWQAKILAKRLARQAIRDSLMVDTGKTGAAPERDAKAIADLGWTAKLKNMFMSLSSFEEVLRYTFGMDSVQAIRLADQEREAAYAYEDAVQAMGDLVHAHFTAIGGDSLAGEKIRYALSQKNKTVGKRTLSEMEIMQAALMWQQKDGQRHMLGKLDESNRPIGTWHYDQAWMDEAMAQLSPEGLSTLAFIRAIYAAEYGPLNAMYRARHGVDLPQNANYAPVTVAPAQAKAGEMIDPVGGGTTTGSILTPGSLRTRSRSAIAEPDFKDALQVMLAHTKQMEHWKAYYDFAVEAQAVLGNRELGNAVEARAGAQGKLVLRKWIDVFAQGGTRDAGAGLAMNLELGSATGRAARMALVGRVGTLMIQSTQLGAAIAEMPSGAYLLRLGKLTSGQLGWKAAMGSSYIQRRMLQAPPIVQQALAGLSSDNPTVVKHAVQRLGTLISGADALFTAGTYAMILDYQMGEAARLGLTGPAAEAYAHKAAERSVERVAQPTRAGTRSLYENTATSPAGKLGWAFASEARQKIALAAWAAQNVKADPARAARVAVVVWGVGGLMAAVLRNAWRDLRDDDDDEVLDDKHWKLSELVASTIAGPLTGIPLIGEALQSAIAVVTGGWDSSGNLLSGLGKGVGAAGDLLSGEFLEADEPVEDVMKDAEAVLMMMGLFNENLASASSIAHLVRDGAAVVDGLYDTDKERLMKDAANQRKLEAAQDKAAKAAETKALTKEQQEALEEEAKNQRKAKKQAAREEAAAKWRAAQ